MEREKKGFIYSWSPLQNGFVITPGKEIFFLHFTAIVQGADRAEIGQPVEFDVAPARPGKRYCRAVNAVIGCEPAKPAAPAATSTNGGNQQ